MHRNSRFEIAPREYSEAAGAEDGSGFRVFSEGVDVWEGDAMRETILEDRLRFFLEECDCPQGLQVFADTWDAFGGFSAKAIESMKDYVEKLDIFVYGINKSSAMATTFNSTTLLAASLDSLSLPTRVPHMNTTLRDVYHPLLDVGQKNIAALGISAGTGSQLYDSLSRAVGGDRIGWIHDATLSRLYDQVENHYGQVTILRGFMSGTETEIHRRLEGYTALYTPRVGGQRNVRLQTRFPLALSHPTTSTPDKSCVLTQLRRSPAVANLARDSATALSTAEERVRRLLCASGSFSRDDYMQSVETLLSLEDSFAQALQMDVAALAAVTSKLNVACSLLSAVSAISVLALMLVNNRPSDTKAVSSVARSRLLLLLFVADAINGTANGVMGVMSLTSGLPSGPLCSAGGWIGQWSVQMSDLTTFALAVLTYAVSKSRNLGSLSRRLARVESASAWVVAVIAVVPAATATAGYMLVGMIRLHARSQDVYDRVVSLKTLGAIIAMYIDIFIFFRRKINEVDKGMTTLVTTPKGSQKCVAERGISSDSVDAGSQIKSESEGMKMAILKLLVYPSVYTLLWIPGLANRMAQATSASAQTQAITNLLQV
ncbi:Protein misato 1 [Irineochytrium annulatum]|nr:Protein misato 1 [Irineochytrium annulatum]